MSKSPLLSEIEAFLKRSKMAESTFGQKSIRQWRLVERLRDGGDVTTRKAAEIRAFIRAWKPPERPAA